MKRAMSRRSFLVGAGSSAAAVMIAGCSAGNDKGFNAASNGNDKISIPPNSIFHYITTGQSLAVGMQGVPVLSTTQPFANKMFTFPTDDPNFQYDPVTFNAVTNGYPIDVIPFRALLGGPSISGANGTFETIANGFADSLTDLVPAYEQLMSCSGVGGYTYAQLAGPTDYPPIGSAPFLEMMSQVYRGQLLAVAAGLSYSVAAMLLVHGEFDSGNYSYATNLKTWQSDMQNGVNNFTGRNDIIPMIAAQTQGQTGSEGGYNTMPFAPTAGALGTWAASLANPGLIYLACPEYMMAHHYYEDAQGNPDPTGQPVHMTADGYRHLGLMMAKAAYAVCLAKTPWLPLMPVSVALSGNTIRIEYHVPVGPLVIDTSYVTDPGNYGFNYGDYAGTTIAGVAVTGPNEVTMTLSYASSGGFVSYALVDPGPNYGQGFGPTAGQRGCVRDSDPTVSYYSNSVTGEPYAMQNYSVIWQASVTSDAGFSFT
jgi:hypothetical protein